MLPDCPGPQQRTNLIPLSAAVAGHNLLHDSPEQGMMFVEVKCPIGKVIPGWREQVEPFRQDALFLHSVWQSAGRPTTGGLHNFRNEDMAPNSLTY